ncbi:MAG TPA: stage II sporulation protein P [Bacillota bacterium]|jgi:stage II sporulation protein P|nr:stage II sporulation protein P [Bacillota bacterium]HOL14660.1 stage II sporulation protein P [Bacillota bacterium]HPZ11068.1 stage II sporulation protein P [Bacillota bacterium]HQE09722.1 stage II sporulation protein P [Bacillota bacterium]
MKATHKRAVVLALVILLGAFAAGSKAAENFFDLFNLSESRDGYYTMKDLKDGSPVLRTARILHPGDEYIDEANRYYRVVRLEEKTAWVEQVKSKGPLAGEIRGPLSTGGEMAAAGDQKGKPAVGIYHTHGAESYVPSDGTDTIDQGGGILQVGDTLAKALENKGFDVNHVREPHTPHDAGAYQRSRRTAEKLLTQGDQIIFDMHRDAVPPEEYEEEVEGEEVTKILLVVGQQNQNADNNRNFALKLKEIADKEHPGLIKGILGAQGNYNQDLTSQGILLEVGAHENEREDAENAVALFADVVEIYVAGSAASPGETAQSNRLSLGSVLKVFLLLAAVLLAYLLIAAGSLEEFKRKISNFFRREFADLRNFNRRDRGGRKDE